MIVTASKVLPITRPYITNGALLLHANKIKAVGSSKEILRQYPNERVVELDGFALMPGLINLHTHLDLSHLKGAAGEKDDFVDWITALVDAKKKIGDKGVVPAARKALREAVSTGTTCIGDISSSDVTMGLLVKSGIRAVSFLEVIGLDGSQARAIFKRLMERLKGYGDLPDRIRLGISPHSAYSVSTQLYKLLSCNTSCINMLMAIHLSESIYESSYMSGKSSRMDRYMEKFGWDSLEPNRGRTSLEFIKGFGLEKGMLAVHGVHLTDGDITLLRDAGASVAHCPRSNYMLKVGKAPVEKLIAKGVNVGIGTDSLASNVDLDLWEEMRFAYLVNRLQAEPVIRMATINGAKALRLDGVTGSLEAGKDADIIAIKMHPSKSKDIYQQLLMDTRPGDIAMTMVQGRPIYREEGFKARYGL